MHDSDHTGVTYIGPRAFALAFCAIGALFLAVFFGLNHLTNAADSVQPEALMPIAAAPGTAASAALAAGPSVTNTVPTTTTTTTLTTPAPAAELATGAQTQLFVPPSSRPHSARTDAAQAPLVSARSAGSYARVAVPQAPPVVVAGRNMQRFAPPPNSSERTLPIKPVKPVMARATWTSLAVKAASTVSRPKSRSTAASPAANLAPLISHSTRRPAARSTTTAAHPASPKTLSVVAAPVHRAPMLMPPGAFVGRAPAKPASAVHAERPTVMVRVERPRSAALLVPFKASAALPAAGQLAPFAAARGSLLVATPRLSLPQPAAASAAP